MFNLTILQNVSFGNFIVIIIAVILILWLSRRDFISYEDGDHRDFKSVIISIGVLGTFIGILIGLWEFDSAEISNSVPKLLNGLKTAFITSIFGMFFAVLLSIVQKIKKVDNSEDEITTLKQISRQLKDLDILQQINENISGFTDIKESIKVVPLIHSKLDAIGTTINDMGNGLSNISRNIETLEVIPLLNAKLDSIDGNIKTLSIDISSVKDELKENQIQLFDFLKDKLEAIDKSLKEAVETLAEGATEEIIKALETVISDFNNNLTEQFGDNFKQLNAAVLNMIEWQNNYKNSIIQFEQSLKETIGTTNDLLKTSVEQYKKLNQDTQDKTKEILSHLEKSSEITVKNAEQIKGITKNYETIAIISKDLKDVITTNQNQIQNLEQHLSNLEKIGKDAGGITKELADFSTKIQGSLSEQSNSITTLTKNIEQQLPRALNELERTLTTLTQKFADDYQEFLNRFNEIKQKITNDK